MDVNNVNNFQTPTPSTTQATASTSSNNGFSLVSLIMGICALVFLCCCGGIVFGALGIIFAILSRGMGSMNTQAKVGLGLSITGIVLSFIMVPIMLVAIYTSPEFDGMREQLEQEFSPYYSENYYDWDYDRNDFLEKYDRDLLVPDLDSNIGDI